MPKAQLHPDDGISISNNQLSQTEILNKYSDDLTDLAKQ